MTIRFSIGLLMAVVFFVAADFALVRALWGTAGPSVGVAIATLPMANLLLLAIPKLRVADTTRHFWLGFEVVGWMMVFVVGHLLWHYPDTFFWPLYVFGHSLGLIRGGAVGAAKIALMISFTVFLYLTPQLLAAVLAGRWSARYRVVIERR